MSLEVKRLTKEQQRKHNALNTNLKYYLKVSGLRIKNKITGDLSPLVLNKAQAYIDELLDKQLRDTGRVRALIVKGRQQGSSTYVGARFYHKTTRRRNRHTYILTHESEATKTLFENVENMRESTAGPLQPTLDEDNAKRLDFDKLNSSYQVGTAGNKAGGRSTTIDLFHGSEVAHWPNAKGVRSGVMQAIRTGRAAKDTEVIFESTANGMDEMFFPMCMDAIAGKGEYILIFVPWFWQEEYQEEREPNGFEMDEEDEEYMELYGLTVEQMWWRFNKIIELKGKELFKQEYPATVMEAFESSGDRLISLEDIQRARKTKLKDMAAPLVMGVDPARNRDRAIIAYRRGREIPSIDRVQRTNDDMMLVGIIAKKIDKHKPVKCFIDCTNSYAIYDRLVELGYGSVVEAILFSSKAFESNLYINKRTEMWCDTKEWIEEKCSIPDEDDIARDLGCMPDKKPTSGGKWKFPRKDEIKKDLGFSPDIGDAICLTFAAPVESLNTSRNSTNIKRTNGLRSKRRKAG